MNFVEFSFRKITRKYHVYLATARCNVPIACNIEIGRLRCIDCITTCTPSFCHLRFFQRLEFGIDRFSHAPPVRNRIYSRISSRMHRARVTFIHAVAFVAVLHVDTIECTIRKFSAGWNGAFRCELEQLDRKTCKCKLDQRFASNGSASPQKLGFRKFLFENLIQNHVHVRFISFKFNLINGFRVYKQVCMFNLRSMTYFDMLLFCIAYFSFSRNYVRSEN